MATRPGTTAPLWHFDGNVQCGERRFRGQYEGFDAQKLVLEQQVDSGILEGDGQ